MAANPTVVRGKSAVAIMERGGTRSTTPLWMGAERRGSISGYFGMLRAISAFFALFRHPVEKYFLPDPSGIQSDGLGGGCR